jgi:phosphate-selective porin OprO/OprP
MRRPILILSAQAAIVAGLEAAPAKATEPTAAAPPACGSAESEKAAACPKRHRGPLQHSTFVARSFIQYDVAHYFQAPVAPPQLEFRRGSVGAPPNPETAQAPDLPDGGFLRRARIGGGGDLGDDMRYRVMFELGNERRGNTRVVEAWLAYTRFTPVVIQAGAFPQPANLEDVTSSNSTLFLERAAPAQIARNIGAGDGRYGLTVKYWDSRWTAALSFTGKILDQPETNPQFGAVVARATHVFYSHDLDSIHAGLSGTYVPAPANQAAGFHARLRDQPELNVDNVRLIDTGKITAERQAVAGGEFAAQHKNLYLQAEGFWFWIGRHPPTSLSNPQFFGFYVAGSWVLTGEHRRFVEDDGWFRPPTPSRPVSSPGGFGAWELALRYSRTNLNYHPGDPGEAPPADGIRGGDQKILTFGVNWYPTAKATVMFDFMNTSVYRLNPASPSNPQPFGAPPLTPPIGVQIGQNLNMLAVRGQYVF